MTVRLRIIRHVKIAISQYVEALADCKSDRDRKIILDAKTDAEEILRWLESNKTSLD